MSTYITEVYENPKGSLSRKIFDLIINPRLLPKGQSLKRDAEIYIGAKSIDVPSCVKEMIDTTQIQLSHRSKRDSIIHILTAVAVSQKEIILDNDGFPMISGDEERKGE